MRSRKQLLFIAAFSLCFVSFTVHPNDMADGALGATMIGRALQFRSLQRALTKELARRKAEEAAKQFRDTKKPPHLTECFESAAVKKDDEANQARNRRDDYFKQFKSAKEASDQNSATGAKAKASDPARPRTVNSNELLGESTWRDPQGRDHRVGIGTDPVSRRPFISMDGEVIGSPDPRVMTKNAGFVDGFTVGNETLRVQTNQFGSGIDSITGSNNSTWTQVPAAPTARVPTVSATSSQLSAPSGNVPVMTPVTSPSPPAISGPSPISPASVSSGAGSGSGSGAIAPLPVPIPTEPSKNKSKKKRAPVPSAEPVKLPDAQESSINTILPNTIHEDDLAFDRFLTEVRRRVDEITNAALRGR